jgi:hypothetical protein
MLQLFLCTISILTVIILGLILHKMNKSDKYKLWRNPKQGCYDTTTPRFPPGANTGTCAEATYLCCPGLVAENPNRDLIPGIRDESCKCVPL